MVKAGHRWVDVQNYPLSTIGVFVRATMTDEKMQNMSNIVATWQANNLSHEGIKKLLKDHEKESNGGKIKAAPQKEVSAGWKALATASKGLK